MRGAGAEGRPLATRRSAACKREELRHSAVAMAGTGPPLALCCDVFQATAAKAAAAAAGRTARGRASGSTGTVLRVCEYLAQQANSATERLYGRSWTGAPRVAVHA